MAKKITWDDDGIIKALDTLPRKMDAYIYASIGLHARKAQKYARQNAKWTDRTSNARNGLFGKSFREKPRYALVLYGTVTYQPYLEVRFSGRYAIIKPTLDHEGPELMRTLSKGFAVIFGGM